MTELNHNEQQFAGQKTESADPNDIQSITIHDIISMMLSKWHWFAISVVLFIAAAAFYIMRTSPVYHREATIMVKDSRKGSGSSEMAVFSELSGFSTRRNVDNELFVLQARRLMMDVVERLNLTIGYTIPERLTKKININKLRAYFTVENLLTFDNLKVDIDPEINTGNMSAGSNYAIGQLGVTTPLPKYYTLGLQLTL